MHTPPLGRHRPLSGLLVVTFVVLTGLSSWPRATSAAPRAGVLATELENGGKVSAHALTRALQQALGSVGLVSASAQTVELYRHGLRAPQLLASKAPAALAKARNVDLALAARLALRLRRPKGGPISYAATLELRIREVGTGHAIANFEGTHEGTARTSGAARSEARRLLLQKAWKQLKAPLSKIASGQGEVLLFVEGLPLRPYRFASMLASLPSIADARVLGAGSSTTFSVRAAPKASAGIVAKLLRERLGLHVDTRRKLAWRGRWRGVPQAYAVRCVAAKAAAADPLSRAAATLAPKLLCRALSASLRVRPRADGGSLTVTLSRTSLRAALASGLSAQVPLRHGAAGLAVATRALATKLDRAAAQRPALAALPALNQLRGGITLRSLDLVGVLAGARRLRGRRGPATLELSKAVIVELEVPEYAPPSRLGKTKRASAKGLRLRSAALVTLSQPTVTSLLLRIRSGEGRTQRVDELALALPLWSRQIVDEGLDTSLAGLLDVDALEVQRRLAAALPAASKAPSLQRLERGLWVPLAAYSALFAPKPQVLVARPRGPLGWIQPPPRTLRGNAGTRRDLALAFASLVQAGGARTRLFNLPDGVLVAADTGWLPSAAGLAGVDKARFVALQGTLWLAHWIDGSGDWARATRLGAKRLRALRRKQVGLEIVSSPPALPKGKPMAAVRAHLERAAAPLIALQRARAKAIVKRARLDRGSLRKRLEVARRLLRIRAVARARQLLEGFLVMHERDAKAHLLLAVSYAYQGAFELARRHFRRGRGAKAQLGVGLMSLLLGDDKAARKALARAGAPGKAATKRLASLRPVGADPQARALGVIAGAGNLRQREALLGRRFSATKATAPADRRRVRWALDLLRY